MTGSDWGVLLVEDDDMVRSWVRMSLAGTEFRLAAEASAGASVAELVERRNPDVLLIDYRLPDGTGTELLRALRLGGVATPAVLMTANAVQGLNEEVREAGGQGSVLKSGRVDELLYALRTAVAGERSFDIRHPGRPSGRSALTPRERDVLRLVAGGSTNRQIAAELEVGDETVKTLLARTFAKLGVHRRAEAVAAAYDRGLL